MMVIILIALSRLAIEMTLKKGGSVWATESITAAETACTIYTI
jgi:hypothetical protein